MLNTFKTAHTNYSNQVIKYIVLHFNVKIKENQDNKTRINIINDESNYDLWRIKYYAS